MYLAIVNQSARLAGQDVALQAIASACSEQLRLEVGPRWRLVVPMVTMFSGAGPVPVDARPIFLVDKADVPDADGYHAVDPATGHPFSTIQIPLLLDNGATILEGPNSISVTVSHEVVEMVCDWPANRWASDDSGMLEALEACDPCQDGFYMKQVGGLNVAVSNFVMPEYFESRPEDNPKQLDFLGQLTKPFTRSAGGYRIVEIEGGVKQDFGHKFPEWLKTSKAKKFDHRRKQRSGRVPQQT